MAQRCLCVRSLLDHLLHFLLLTIAFNIRNSSFLSSFLLLRFIIDAANRADRAVSAHSSLSTSRALSGETFPRANISFSFLHQYLIGHADVGTLRCSLILDVVGNFDWEQALVEPSSHRLLVCVFPCEYFERCRNILLHL